MGDYKEAIFQIADELARNTYDKEFYALTEQQQEDIWREAEQTYFERLYSIADSETHRPDR